jgi:hypothetical protein
MLDFFADFSSAFAITPFLYFIRDARRFARARIRACRGARDVDFLLSLSLIFFADAADLYADLAPSVSFFITPFCHFSPPPCRFLLRCRHFAIFAVFFAELLR